MTDSTGTNEEFPAPETPPLPAVLTKDHLITTKELEAKVQVLGKRGSLIEAVDGPGLGASEKDQFRGLRIENVGDLLKQIETKLNGSQLGVLELWGHAWYGGFRLATPEKERDASKTLEANYLDARNAAWVGERLSRLPWSENGVIVLNGCNVGNQIKDSWVQTFADKSQRTVYAALGNSMGWTVVQSKAEIRNWGWRKKGKDELKGWYKELLQPEGPGVCGGQNELWRVFIPKR